MSRRDLTLPKETLYRAATLSRGSVDEEGRTAEFSFSSEEPVERLFGLEILDHDPSSVRLGRLADGGPVLVGHNPDDHVGVVERVNIAGGKGRVVARFSRSQRGQDVFRDIVDGIRRNVSVGYRVHRAEAVDDKSAPNTFRITDWEPYEVSIVSMGADASVGVGRSHQSKGHSPMKDEDDIIETDDIEETETRAMVPDPITTDIQEIEDEAVKKERGRHTEIQAIAAKFPHSKKVQVAARAAIQRGESWQDFGKRALELLATESNGAMPTELGLTGKEVKRYSILRMLRAQAEAQARQVPIEKIAPFEYRIHLDLMDALPAKRQDLVRGMLVPYDVQMHAQWSTRVPPADTTENASLVGTDHLAGSFIQGIRQTSAVMLAGATPLAGLVGDVSIPREESVPFEWLQEDEDATDVDYVTSSVTLSPTTVAAAVPVTRRLLKQSSPDVDMALRNNLTRGAGEEIDKQSLVGTGVDPLPLGVRNQAGVGTVLIATGALTWPNAVAFESDVEINSNLIEGAAYIMHPTMKGIAKTTSKDAGSGMFIWQDNAVNGYPAFSSTHAGLTADGIVFGNFANVLIGFWGVLDLMTDMATKAASGGIVIRAFQDIQVAVRRGEAFAIETIT